MKTVCFLVKIELPDTATPHNQPDIQAGLLEYVIQHRVPYLYAGGGAIVSVYPIVCAFTQPGALCKHTIAELNEAAESEAA